MVQHKRQIKAQKNQQSQQVEHTEVFDDNLLPAASEIQQLHNIDPTILSWLKTRAEKEQNFRHEAFDKRITCADRLKRRDQFIGIYALTIYFLLVSGCAVFSYLLLRDGHNVQGSLFGGAAVILAFAVLFAKRQRKIDSEKEQ